MSNNFLSNLLLNEKLIYKTNPHWLFIVIPIFGIFIFWLVYLLFICSFIGGVLLIELVNFCISFTSFASAFLVLVLYLDWRFNRFYLTNLRLIKERGIIGKSFMTINLENIENITCNFGIWGRIFRFGDLIIESAGIHGKMVFEKLPRPMRIKWRIEKKLF